MSDFLATKQKPKIKKPKVSKPPKPYNVIDDIIPHKVRVKIVERMVFPDTLAGGGSVWSRELKLLKQIASNYPHARFWSEWSPGYQLHSFAFFKTAKGLTELKQAWRLFLFHDQQSRKAQEAKKELDNSPKSDKMGEIEVAPAPRKQTVMDWVDSPQHAFTD